MSVNAWLTGPMFRLNVVVMSSLGLLAYGLRTPSGPIEVLQLPVAALQIYFILAMAMQVGFQGLVAPLTTLQRGLIGALLVYVTFVSVTSQVPSAPMLAPSWIIHILFFVALIAFFRNVGLDQVDGVWTILGLTALFHVCAFLVAWALWPDEIRLGNLPAFGNVRHLGYFVAPAAAVMAMQFVQRVEKSLLRLVCFAVAVFYIIYTGSRGGAVALVVGLVAAGLYLKWHRQKVYVSRAGVLLLVTCALALVSELLPPPPWPPLFSRELATEAGVLNGRNEVWAAVVLAIEQDWLWGYGPALVSQLPSYQIQVPYYQPHNIGLQLLLHWGIVGTLIVLATVSSFAANVKTALCSQPRQALLPITVLVTMFVHALIDGGLFYPFSTVLAIIAFAYIEAIGRLINNQTTAWQASAGSGNRI